ncbi:hypothetical protein [Peptostreptococcus faecalis]|uniref:hypothetical protein n=1 Tax=Peptostreptococcus faecalis TaxID=2045015 RepID=UPI000C7E737C|nr:hypothetical protein [Peptostreptococcus faecalis]
MKKTMKEQVERIEEILDNMSNEEFEQILREEIPEIEIGERISAGEKGFVNYNSFWERISLSLEETRDTIAQIDDVNNLNDLTLIFDRLYYTERCSMAKIVNCFKFLDITKNQFNILLNGIERTLLYDIEEIRKSMKV